MFDRERASFGHAEPVGSAADFQKLPEKRNVAKAIPTERLPMAGTHALDEYRLIRELHTGTGRRALNVDVSANANASLERLRDWILQEYRQQHPKESSAIDFTAEFGNYDVLLRAEVNKQLDALEEKDPSVDELNQLYIKVRERVANWFDRIAAAKSKPRRK